MHNLSQHKSTVLCILDLNLVTITAYIVTKSVLGRVRNCVDEQALRCEMVVSSYVFQPNHSYADSILRHTRGCVVAGAAQCL